MLAVDPEFRRCGLGRRLIKLAIDRMKEQEADEVILETEITNIAALKLYECKFSSTNIILIAFGFIRDKRL